MKPLYREHYLWKPEFYFRELLELEWLAVTEARSEYFMSDVPRSYVYGKGENAREYLSKPYCPHVAYIQAFLNEKYSCNYNVCFLNRYDNQKQALGWHADDSPTMDRNHPIAVVSFGAEREIWWKLKDEKGVVPADQRQLLGNGSLFIMPAGFQDFYFHRIPRADREVGTRISLTFRRYV